VGDVFGVAIVVAASEAVLSASYQREAEARADETAFDILAEAGLPSDPFARFFERLVERYGASQGVMEYLSSHPPLGTRAERAAAADDNRPASFRPVLSDREWIALRNICTQSAAEPDT
ncbi:MAG: M48 family metalloprotease, partial [Pseudomonadota bacterium]